MELRKWLEFLQLKTLWRTVRMFLSAQIVPWLCLTSVWKHKYQSEINVNCQTNTLMQKEKVIVLQGLQCLTDIKTSQHLSGKQTWQAENVVRVWCGETLVYWVKQRYGWVGFGIAFFFFFFLSSIPGLLPRWGYVTGCIHVFSSACCCRKRYSLQSLWSKGEKGVVRVESSSKKLWHGLMWSALQSPACSHE